MENKKKDAKLNNVITIFFSISLAITIICSIFLVIFNKKLIHSSFDDKMRIESAIGGLLFFLILFAIITIILFLLIIRIPRKVQYDDSIENEPITDYNNINLTKNNVYSLFKIKVIIKQAVIDTAKVTCTIRVKPQLSNYLYMSSSITFIVNEEYEHTVLLNSKGEGKSKIQVELFKNKQNYKITKTNGSMLRKVN